MSRTTRNSNIKLVVFLLFGSALLGGGFLLRMKYPNQPAPENVGLVIQTENTFWSPPSNPGLRILLSGVPATANVKMELVLESKDAQQSYLVPLDARELNVNPLLLDWREALKSGKYRAFARMVVGSSNLVISSNVLDVEILN